MLYCDNREEICESVGNGDVNPGSDLEHALEKESWQPAVDPVIVQGCCHEEAHKFEAQIHHEMSVGVGSIHHYLLMKYALCLEKAPCAFICLYLVLFIGIFASMWRGLEIETDFSVFIRSDGEALRNRDALILALEKQKSLNGRRLSDSLAAATQHRMSSAGNASTSDRRNLRATHFLRRDLQFLYQATGGNALDEKVLREIRNFESRLRSLPKWQEFCVARAFTHDSVWLCDPGVSLSKWAWASRTKANRTLYGEDVAFDVHFDAEGRDLFPFTWMFPYMEHALQSGDASGDVKRFLPEDWDKEAFLAGTGSPPATIKSFFAFVVGYTPEGITQADIKKADRAVKAEVKEFFQTDIYEEIQSWIDADPEEVGKRHMRVFYKTKHITELELELSLNHDLLLSTGSVSWALPNSLSAARTSANGN